jgi:hypothetical protein
MAEPIQANYVPDGDDWTITVSGRGKKLTASAPGIIAARDRTDQLVEELAPDEEYRTVVHLLNGDAVQFTTAYLTARMAKSEPPPPEPEAEDKKPARKTPSPRPRADEEKPKAQASGAETAAP